MLTGLAMLAAIRVVGPAGALVPGVLAAGAVLLRYPGVAMSILLCGIVLVEQSDFGILPPLNRLYEPVAASLTLPELLLLTGLAGVVLRFARGGERPRLPDPLTIPAALLLVSIAAGTITGYYAGVSPNEMFHLALPELYLVLVPLLVVNVVRDTGALRLFAAVAAGFAAYKGLSGVFGALSGLGETVADGSVSYLDPLANLLMLGLLLAVVAARIQHVPLPAWVYAGVPLAALALALSYRRSFWLAAGLAIVLVAIVASRRRGRTTLVIAAVALAVTVTTTLTLGESNSNSPLVQRAQSLDPASSSTTSGDRYRRDEQRNVIADLRAHPLTGLGIGVGWEVRYPTAESHDRRYTHVAVLSYWMRFGPLGAIAYLALFGAGMWAAVGVWRRHADPIVRVTAIAGFGSLVALLIVELTATFSGIEPRLSLFLGALLGWLAAARANVGVDAPASGRPQPASR